MRSRDRVLELLEQNKGSFISGESIASSLGISRNAIWKAINDLRESGYEIDAVKNKGYCLADSNDILSKQGIESFLSNNSEVKIIYYPTVGSTNQLAKEMAIEGGNFNTVIVANAQTGGVAHNGKSFSSPEGGLYMSVILSPAILDTIDQSLISYWAATIGCKALEQVGCNDASIELINDLYIGEAKAGGILTESAFDFETEKLQWIIIGIGFSKKVCNCRNELAAKIIEGLTNIEDFDKAAVKKYYKQHHR